MQINPSISGFAALLIPQAYMYGIHRRIIHPQTTFLLLGDFKQVQVLLLH